MKKSGKICAGIVLYNPDIQRLRLVIKSICNQVDEMVLVDNGSENLVELQCTLEDYENVTLIKNAENEGIAKALNQICSFAVEKGYIWCLTLDHDTICHESMVNQLMSYEDNERVGIICPRVDYEGINIKQKNSESETVDVYACMTSGSLTNLNAWEEVGGFREDYFIDFVDNEFCMRLGLVGYRIVRVNGCVMHHQLGDTRDKKILGFRKTVSIHSPRRYYYMTRNNLSFISEYKSHLNVLKEYLKLMSILFSGTFYADDVKETLLFIKKGISDAHNGRMGKLTI